MKKFDNEIYAYALKNAIEFGKADAGRILPKLFLHGLDKKDIKLIMPEIVKIVGEVNKSKDKEKEFEKYKKYVMEKEEEKEKDLPELPNALDGKVVTRMPPEPSKYAHIGHAITFLINYIYAKKYNGKCLLRFEDANPSKVNQEFVDSMLDDIENYLGIKPDGIRYVSDDMPKLYECVEKIIKNEKAYVCFCDRDKMQDYRHKGKECECRGKSAKENLNQWKEFLKGKYKEGKAVLRIKGDMKSDNHVLRDSVIFRKIDAEHYRQGKKYSVWPTYEFYSPIEEDLMNITHVLRSNEFEERIPLQELIKSFLNLKKQTIVQYGRVNVIDSTTKGREVRELVESGEYLGWDDPRLVTLKALKRRGIVKEAFYELVKHLGLVKHPVNLDFDMIAAINRKIIDEKAGRYSFVENPVKLDISGKPKIDEIKIPVHPDRPEEKRKIEIGKDIFISSGDMKEFKGEEIRLLHLYNIKLGNKSKFTSSENKNIQKINWVSEYVNVKILMPNALWKEGFADKGIEELSEGDIIQFERFGFARLDKIVKKGKSLEYEFWYGHR